MQGTKEHALANAQAYANRNDVTVHVWNIYNGMHQFMYCEWYPEEWKHYFTRKPDYIINPQKGNA